HDVRALRRRQRPELPVHSGKICLQLLFHPATLLQFLQFLQFLQSPPAGATTPPTLRPIAPGPRPSARNTCAAADLPRSPANRRRCSPPFAAAAAADRWCFPSPRGSARAPAR